MLNILDPKLNMSIAINLKVEEMRISPQEIRLISFYKLYHIFQRLRICSAENKYQKKGSFFVVVAQIQSLAKN